MFNLTINAVPASTIIVGRRATWLDRHAAEELRDYVKKILLSAALDLATQVKPMQAIVRSLLPLPQSQVFTKRVFQDIHAKLFILLKLFETWFDMPQPIFPFDCFLFCISICLCCHS